MTKRLDILKASLVKKEARFDELFNTHVSTVKQANGQPLNDKRNGAATLRKWERQENALRNVKEEIEKTKAAIEREENKIAGVDYALENLPAPIVELIENGTLIQWRKHPNIFFVKGIDKARIGWDWKKKHVYHKFSKTITDKDQWKLFAQTFNNLQNAIKHETN